MLYAVKSQAELWCPCLDQKYYVMWMSGFQVAVVIEGERRLIVWRWVWVGGGVTLCSYGLKKTPKGFNIQGSMIIHLPLGKSVWPCRFPLSVSLCVFVYWGHVMFFKILSHTVRCYGCHAEADRRPVDAGGADEKEHSLSWCHPPTPHPTLLSFSLSLIGSTGYLPLEDVWIPV